MSDEGEPMGEMRRGTVQLSQLRERWADIAWTALCVVLVLWVALNLLGVARGWENAWNYCAVGVALLGIAWWMRILSIRSRARRRV
ncbi:hypothetical protein [Streptomyces sp. NPDC059076]|uniref:hypothetical protein n=1 Tax=unclassified Streptomyces TaxID=2593676 RepID=UPI0036A27206